MPDVNAFSFGIGTAAWIAAILHLGRERGVLFGNVAWLAFLYFGLLNKQSVMWMLSRSQRKNTELVHGVSSAMGFLGGMNAGMTSLSGLFLAARWSASSGLFAQPAERAVLYFGFGVAHLSQALYQKWNPPGILWYIYWIDVAMAAANVYCAITLL